MEEAMKRKPVSKSKPKAKRIKVTEGKAAKVKRVPKRKHSTTAYNAALQHNANLRFALQQIRDLERPGAPGMRAGGPGGLEAAQEIAIAALEPAKYQG
jgi:hypothetical protein